MQKIVPQLWFDDQAEEAARFYAALFRGAAIRGTARYGSEGFEIHGQPEGRVMTVERGGSVRLDSFRAGAEWMSASIMPRPGLAAAS